MTIMKEIMWEWDGPEDEMSRPRRPGGGGSDVGDVGLIDDPEDPSATHTQLWREHGQTMAGGGIHVVVCCCNEDAEELQVMLSTFRSELQAPCRVGVTFILDSHKSGYFEERSETYMALRQLLSISEPAGKSEEKNETGSESFGEFGCIRHSGVLAKTPVPFDLYLKGPSLPQGKRNSLVLFFDEILPAKITRGEAAEPEAVYILDADSGHPNNGLNDVCLMWRLLMAEEETAAYTCPVRPVNHLESFLAASQALEYAQVWDCVGESYYAAQTTARGTSIMLKYSCLIEDGRGALPPCGEGAQVPLLEAFAKTAASLSAMILLDTSPTDGILVLLRQRGYEIRSCAVADAVTCVPNSLLEFYAQRRRWYAGSVTTVLSSLTGRECYVQQYRGRLIIHRDTREEGGVVNFADSGQLTCLQDFPPRMSIYTMVFNLYLHTGVIFIPVLLTKGTSVIWWRFYGSDGNNDGDDDYSQLEWTIFLGIWGFLALNTLFYTCGSYKQLWMWINISSVLWMVYCALVLIGVSALVTPWVVVAVVIAPFLVGALNVAGGNLTYWACMAISAVPFVLVTSVHAVLVLLFAVATADSKEWGTRDVAAFDSGVSRRRASAMFRQKLILLIWVLVASCGLGAAIILSATYTLLPIAAGVAVVAYALKLLVSVLPSKLERARQRVFVGEALLDRPPSFRRGRTELAQIHSRGPDARPGSQSRNSMTRKSAAVSGYPTETGSYVTADDGTPSPGSEPAFPFATNSANSTAADGAQNGTLVTPPHQSSETVNGVEPLVLGHSRSHSNGSRSSRRGKSRSRSRSPSTSSRASGLTSGTSRMSTSGMTISESLAGSEGLSMGDDDRIDIWDDSPVQSRQGSVMKAEAPSRPPIGSAFSGLFSSSGTDTQVSTDVQAPSTGETSGEAKPVTPGVVSAGDGAASIGDGAASIGDGAASIGDGAASVGDGAASVGDGAANVGDGPASVDDGPASVGDGAASVGDGAASVGDGAASVGDGSASVGDGSASVGDGSASVGDGSASVGDGARPKSASTNSEPADAAGGASSKSICNTTVKDSGLLSTKTSKVIQLSASVDNGTPISGLAPTPKVPSVLESNRSGNGIDGRASPTIVAADAVVDDSGGADASPWRPPSIPRAVSSSRLAPTTPDGSRSVSLTSDSSSRTSSGARFAPATPEQSPHVSQSNGSSRKFGSPSPSGKRGWDRRPSSGDDSETERIVAANTARNAVSSLGTRSRGKNLTGVRRAWGLGGGSGSGSDNEADSPVKAKGGRKKNGKRDSGGAQKHWGVEQESFDSDGDSGRSSPVARILSQVQRSSGRRFVGARSALGFGSSTGMEIQDDVGSPKVHDNRRQSSSSRFRGSLRNGWGRLSVSREDSDDERINAAMANSARNAGTGGKNRPGGRNTAGNALAGIRSAWYRADSYDSEEPQRVPNPRAAQNVQNPSRSRQTRGRTSSGNLASWGRSTLDSEDENVVPSPQVSGWGRAGRGEGTGYFNGIRGGWGNSIFGGNGDKFGGFQSGASAITPRSSASSRTPAPPSRPAPQPPAVEPHPIRNPFDADYTDPSSSVSRSASEDRRSRPAAVGAGTTTISQPVTASRAEEATANPETMLEPSALASKAANDRAWGAGQSSVFDSSGSSSDDDTGKPRGLRGVQILTDAALLKGADDDLAAGGRPQTDSCMLGTPAPSSIAGRTPGRDATRTPTRTPDRTRTRTPTRTSKTPTRTPARSTSGGARRNTSAALGLPIGAIGNSVALASNGGGEGRSSSLRSSSLRSSSLRTSSMRSTNFPVPRLETLKGMPGVYSDAEY